MVVVVVLVALVVPPMEFSGVLILPLFGVCPSP